MGPGSWPSRPRPRRNKETSSRFRAGQEHPHPKRRSLAGTMDRVRPRIMSQSPPGANALKRRLAGPILIERPSWRRPRADPGQKQDPGDRTKRSQRGLTPEGPLQKRDFAGPCVSRTSPRRSRGLAAQRPPSAVLDTQRPAKNPGIHAFDGALRARPSAVSVSGRERPSGPLRPAAGAGGSAHQAGLQAGARDGRGGLGDGGRGRRRRIGA